MTEDLLDPGHTRLKAGISYQEVTMGGKLRQPVFLDLSVDTRPEEYRCRLPLPAPYPANRHAEAPAVDGGNPSAGQLESPIEVKLCQAMIEHPLLQTVQ